MMSPAATSAPPIVHAIGGSFGSALALALFYPLERARIELQARASAVPPASPSAAQLQQMSSQNHHGDMDSSNSFVGSASSSPSDLKLHHGAGEETSWASCLEQDFIDSPDRSDSNRMVSTSTISQPPSLSWSMESVKSDEEHDACTQDKTTLGVVSPPPPLSARHSLLRCMLDLHARGALYQGVAPIMTTIFTSQFIFFFMQAYVKKLMDVTRVFGGTIRTQQEQRPALLSLISSSIAGIGNVLLTNPLWVTNMAIVTGETRTQNLITELIEIYRTRGASHLWDGTSASIWLVSNPIIQFFCYEQLKKARLATILSQGKVGADRAAARASISPVSLGPLEAFLFAALSKAIATIVTYPLQLTQTLLRLSENNSGGDDDNKSRGTDKSVIHHNHHRRYNGTIDCLIQLYKTNNKGLAAWYTGMRAKLLQTVLTAAFTFLTYEQILGAVQRVLLARQTLAAPCVP